MGQGDIELLIEAEDQASAVLGSFADAAGNSFQSVRTAANVANNATELFDTTIGTLHERLGSLIEGVDKLTDSINLTPAAMGAAIVAVNLGIQAYEYLKRLWDESAQAAKNMAEAAGEAVKIQEKMNSAILGVPMDASMKLYVDAIKNANEELDKLLEKVAKLPQFQSPAGLNEFKEDVRRTNEAVKVLSADIVRRREEQAQAMAGNLGQIQRDFLAKQKSWADEAKARNMSETEQANLADMKKIDEMRQAFYDFNQTMTKALEAQGYSAEQIRKALEATGALNPDKDQAFLARRDEILKGIEERNFLADMEKSFAVFGTTLREKTEPEIDTHIRQSAAYESRFLQNAPGYIDPSVRASMTNEDRNTDRTIKTLELINKTLEQWIKAPKDQQVLQVANF